VSGLQAEAPQRDSLLYDSVLKTGPGYYALLFVLISTVLWGLYAYITQYQNGLGVTGLNRPVYWGFYITNFVFFVGISHAGTLISAILRLCRAEWRRPITRMAETITVLVLFFGAGNILLDLGRPDRVLYVFRYSHFTSPLMWDVVSITTYLFTSTTYLYVAMIPDIALLRDRTGGWRRPLYRALALGWTGTARQRRRLQIAIAVLAIVVIPIAVSVHTVVSWVFAMTIQPMWHSSIFGPYFVVGAIYSGIAALLLAMALLRKIYHLENYLKEIHFNYLGQLLLVMTLLWFYFTFAEYITTFYGHDPMEMAVFWEKLSGRYAPFFWTMVFTDFVLPLALLCNRKTRTIPGIMVASVSVCIGMWLERFTIVVPTLINPRLPWARGSYMPSWVEVSLFAGFIAGFLLLYTIFVKLFPIISIWEIQEGREEAVSEVVERVKSYLPSEGPGSVHEV
jgi:Ni/Fe-hydrogenase subunit HybB-like protein